MDERQQQIREGAGLDESRLNTDFIELLRKWSSPVLLIAAVLAFGYWGWQKLQESRLNRLNTAFSELTGAAASASPSPDSLRSIAAEFGDVRAVGVLANIEAADVYLRAVRLGVRVGSQPEADETGQTAYKAEDLLTEEDRTRYLTEAATLYKAVIAETENKPGMSAVLTINGLYGLAAVAESRDDLAEARSCYEKVIARAEKAGLPAHATIARERVEGLDGLKATPRIYHQAELPKEPEPVLPVIDEGAEDAPETDPGADPAAEPGDQPAEGDADAPAPEEPTDDAPGDGEPAEGDQPQSPPQDPPQDPAPEPAPDEPK
jgi:hypothetical protein